MIRPLVLLAALAAGPASAPAPVKVQLAEAAPATSARRVAGTVVAAERATVSSRLAARVARVHVREGDRVKRGAPLVSLAADDVRGQLAGARAARDAARAHERRIRSLLAEKAATPAELDQAQAQRAQAEAAVSAAEANLGYAELRAPFDGVVQAKRVQAGDFVGPGQPLLELEGAGGLEIQATVSQAEAGALSVGEELTFEASGEAAGARGRARVVAIAPGGDPVSHRTLVRARVLTPAAGLRSGSFARLELPAAGARTAAVTIPRSAVVERGDLTGVFVVEDGRARLRWLAIGEPAGDRVAVRAGLKPGEPVVAAPGTLADGAAVEVADGR
jgi:RND family efflux transporter MFP subunit